MKRLVKFFLNYEKYNRYIDYKIITKIKLLNMKLTEKRLREIIREELTSTDGQVDELAPVIATVARQAAAGAVADKLSEGLGTLIKKVTEGIVPEPKDLVGLVTASAEMHDADEDDEHTYEGFMGAAKELVENAIAKVVGGAAKDAAADAVKDKIAAKIG
jgi:hypothetical protein